MRLEPAEDPHGEELVQRALAYAQAEHEKVSDHDDDPGPTS